MKTTIEILEEILKAEEIDEITPFDDPWRNVDIGKIIDPAELHCPWWLFCKAPDCEWPFIAYKRNQKYCSRKCSANAARDERRAQHEIEFIGIDGEGVNVLNDAGEIVEHNYVLLCANGINTEPLFLHRDDSRLTTLEILEWLYYTVFPRYPDACFVTFAMGYDLSQWLKSLPKSRARNRPYPFPPDPIREMAERDLARCRDEAHCAQRPGCCARRYADFNQVLRLVHLHRVPDERTAKVAEGDPPKAVGA